MSGYHYFVLNVSFRREWNRAEAGSAGPSYGYLSNTAQLYPAFGQPFFSFCPAFGQHFCSSRCPVFIQSCPFFLPAFSCPAYGKPIVSLWPAYSQRMANLWRTYGQPMTSLWWITYGQPMASHEPVMSQSWKSHESVMKESWASHELESWKSHEPIMSLSRAGICPAFRQPLTSLP